MKDNKTERKPVFQTQNRRCRKVITLQEKLRSQERKGSKFLHSSYPLLLEHTNDSATSDVRGEPGTTSSKTVREGGGGWHVTSVRGPTPEVVLL